MHNDTNHYNNYNYDVFPLVIPAGKETCVRVRPLGGRQAFVPGRRYALSVNELNGGNPKDFPATGNFRRTEVTCGSDGGFEIPCRFDREGEYFLLFRDGDGKEIDRFSVYCVEKELIGRYPFMGDLHVHSNLSDGRETPEVVCANYRKHGYDFTVISDHGRYDPSLRAIESYREVPVEFRIVCGEEVHMPPVYGKKNDVHIVNFGGEYSVNALVEWKRREEPGADEKDPKLRSLNGSCPDVMTYEAFQEKMQALADALTPGLPDSVDAVPYAVCKWVFDEIRKANGLGIFPHPTWRIEAYHVPEAFQDYLFETGIFDAFEVLGGERYYEQNGFQTVRYYEELARGHRFPVVGSTDSHCSYPTNPGAYICSTIIFSPENERTALIRSVREEFSVAVDGISAPEFRLVGASRLIRYGCFLLKHFFPRHDELCWEEGRLMKEYVTGTPEERTAAAETLRSISGRMKKQREKYFAFS